MLVFDFDGILVDSLKEAVLVAYNAALKRELRSIEELPPGYIEVAYANRHHVQPAGDFLPFARWCAEMCAIDRGARINLDQYNRVLAAETVPLKERTASFFAARKRLCQDIEEGWYDFLYPYEPLWSALVKLNHYSPVILTNKNREAVIKICARFKLNVKEDHIFSGDGGVTKFENFHRLHELFGAPKYHFIDDSVLNLQDLQRKLPKTPEVELLHGAWGYVGPEDLNTAKKLGIRTISLAELMSELPKLV